MKNFSKQPIALALGAAFALSAMGAQASVFQATDLGAGYMVASADEGKTGEAKCGEGKCGADKKKADGKCGEKKAEGHCGADAKHKAGEAKCGEGKCGADKKDTTPATPPKK